MKLYQYYQSFGRMGSIEGAFFLTDAEAEKYKEYTDYLYWNELLGKHSEGYFNFSDETLTAVDLPDDVVELLYNKLGKVLSGPFDFEYFDEMIEERLVEEADEDEDDE